MITTIQRTITASIALAISMGSMSFVSAASEFTPYADMLVRAGIINVAVSEE